MKGSNPTAAQKRWHDALCKTVGCVACRQLGEFNPVVSIHHIEGRTKWYAHWLVLPLCESHHQAGTGNLVVPAVHGNEAEFERVYGRQGQLLLSAINTLDLVGIEVPQIMRYFESVLYLNGGRTNVVWRKP
ncbi:MAG: recombinase [Planctomycetaceae bacterium]|nr:recombinase [Planctomycetaceae bacterium]